MLEQVKAVLDIKKEVMEFWRAFRQTFGDNPDYKIVEQFLDKFNELVDKVSRLEAMVTPIVEKVKAKAKKKEVFEQAYQQERIL